MQKKSVYSVEIAGLKRELPLCPISDEFSIAAFVIFGDTELTVAVSKELIERVDDFDVLITAEAKGIPLVYEMARQSGKPYLVARKYPKLYMSDPVEVDVRSITTDKMQTLYVDRHELESIKGKKVLIVDDVISTGESLKALGFLVEKGGGIAVGSCAVFAEGDAADRTDIIFLEKLPIFENN